MHIPGAERPAVTGRTICAALAVSGVAVLILAKLTASAMAYFGV